MTLIQVFAPAGAVCVAAASLWLWIRKNRKTPDEREALRRRRINAAGRITDGTLLDIQEVHAEDGTATQLVIYTYDVAGVQYECSQDVTRLREILDVQTCRIGSTASVKYDARNPGNSIVISETWCGLRTLTS